VITLYLDTSSLVKLYVEQSGSDEVRQELGDAEVGATSLVAYAEARAAFARLRREGSITAVAFRAVKRDFDGDWSKYLVVDPTPELCQTAGELAERYRLRGFDSIHLATFLHVAREARSSEARFSSFDRPLNRAARAALRGIHGSRR
jgi:predicted nucleic acid-binding protein